MPKYNPNDPRISAYVLGELDEKQKLEFESELKESPELQSAVGEIRELTQTLEKGFRTEAAQAPSARITPNLKSGKVRHASSTRRQWILGIVAAVLIIGFALPFAPSWTAPGPIAHSDRGTEVAETPARDADESGPASSHPQADQEGNYIAATADTSAVSENAELVRVDVTFSGDSLETEFEREETVPEIPNSLAGKNALKQPILDAFGGPMQTENRFTQESSGRRSEGQRKSSVEVADEDSSVVEPESAVMMVTPQIIMTDGEERPTPLSIQSPRFASDAAPIPALSPDADSLASSAIAIDTESKAISGESELVEQLVDFEQMPNNRGRGLSVAVEQERFRGQPRGGRRRIESLAKRVVGLKREGLIQEESRSTSDGRGPGWGGDKFEPIQENDFLKVSSSPLSTFSIDVDTASYSKTRQFLMEANSLPRPDAVRIEELLNYFSYDYDEPETDDPFWANTEVAACPWEPKHRLVRVGLQGKDFPKEKRPPTNLVFLLDVSGSMDRPNKLPLLRRSMKLLVKQLGENDRVAITVYAGAAGKVLESTTADNQDEILSALGRLHAGGSTNGGAGIHLAYQTALDNFIKGGVNRVILCTDGDFNVGTTGTDELVRLAEENAKTGVFLSVFGFGMGNHNDSMLEQVSNKGNGNYGFIDSEREARKSFVEQLGGTLITIAKDVKIQIEFNPQQVSAYRLIGYENRILAARDFNDDTKDAGEIGAGHTVTALYEIIPTGVDSDTESAIPAIDELKYQTKTTRSEDASSGELMTLKLRYKQPDGDTSKLLTFPVEDSDKSYAESSKDFRFAASIASFGMLLRESKYKGNATWDSVLELATEGARESEDKYRAEFIEMIQKAKSLSGE